MYTYRYLPTVCVCMLARRVNRNEELNQNKIHIHSIRNRFKRRVYLPCVSHRIKSHAHIERTQFLRTFYTRVNHSKFEFGRTLLLLYIFIAFRLVAFSIGGIEAAPPKETVHLTERFRYDSFSARRASHKYVKVHMVQQPIRCAHQSQKCSIRFSVRMVRRVIEFGWVKCLMRK